MEVSGTSVSGNFTECVWSYDTICILVKNNCLTMEPSGTLQEISQNVPGYILSIELLIFLYSGTSCI